MYDYKTDFKTLCFSLSPGTSNSKQCNDMKYSMWKNFFLVQFLVTEVLFEF